MTLRLSTGLRNAMANSGGFASALNRGCLRIFTGSQPITADSAETGTLLGIATASSGALTQEVQSTATITVAGASGSINTVLVGTFNIIPDGAVNFNTSANQTASDLADAINRNGYMQAVAASAVVTVKSRPGAGTTHNGLALSTAVTTLTATSSGTMASGVAAVNGLMFGTSNAGVIAKLSTQVWSFNGSAAGTAGWFRFIGSVNDPGTAVVAGTPPYYVRLDGSIAVSGADLNMSNIAITVSAPNTIDTFSWTQPAQ